MSVCVSVCWFVLSEELLGQVAEMVSRGEISDASSYFLSPDLMAQLPSQTSPSIPAGLHYGLVIVLP